MTDIKTVVIFAMPGVQLLDVSGPLDVFAEANLQNKHPIYNLCIATSTEGNIRSSSGAQIVPDFIVGPETCEPVDTLLVAGYLNADIIQPDQIAVEWLKRVAPKTRRFGSVCAGAFLLAATGLLDGKRITTHWAVAEKLTEYYPSITVDADAIHVRDGRLRTAAGVTSGLDLALALVEEDLGRELAMKVAAQLVMFFKRPGGQMQFSRKGEIVVAERSALQELQRWIVANPSFKHSVASLAEHMALSPRHFARIFRKEVGITPVQWVEAARVTAARHLLEEGQHTPKQAAGKCGFSNVDIMRKAFLRHVGITPAEYRKRFAVAAS